ncbi:hypothetical protein BS47DRAFT_1367873 [Hydnum rufescens UP504]|uniref:Uncharacterized protein n=1 Tax=Hydnum rufescens UP504 TaxID=1448309 RepID=A0A9P6AI02_9AGAM|nr:hypothetical protein BS47DRAFT_1367873 [Hydnum rufescens UP504]
MARVCTYASKGRSGGKWHAAPGAQTLWHVEALSDVAVSFEMLRRHVNTLTCPIEICQVLWGLGTTSVYQQCPVSVHIPQHTEGRDSGCCLDALALSHYYYNPNPNRSQGDYGPQCQQEKGWNQGEGVNLEGPSESDEHKQDILYSRYNSAVHMAFSPRAWVDLPLYAWEIGMRYLAVFCHRIGVPLTAIWWHDKATCWRPECNDAMSKIGFYSIKDMTRDGLDLSTSFASVHVLLSTFTSEADAISAGFDKAPAMFCNGSSPTKDVMSSQTVLYADALRDFPEGMYVPSPLPPYFDHPFLPHKWYAMPSSLFIAPPVSSTVGSSAASSSATGSSATGSSAAGSSAAGSSAAGSSAIGVKRTLPPLPRFTKRQRTEGVVAEGGDVMMEDGGDVSVPAVDGDRDVVMQDGASVAATTPSSGAAMHSSHNQLHLRDFGSQGEFSPASADMVVGENPKTLHQPLTWADRKGNTEPAPPTLENPYMGVKDYDTWSNQCENEFLKDMDEYKVDPTTKPFPVVKRVEWATLFTNSRWPFQYTEQCPPECKPDIYTRDHASIARHWDKYGAPHFYSTNYTRLPTMYSTQMPYIGYISRRIDDPPLPASLDMISSSDGVKLTDAYRKQLEDFVLRNHESVQAMVSRSLELGNPGFSCHSRHASETPVTWRVPIFGPSLVAVDAGRACNDSTG